MNDNRFCCPECNGAGEWDEGPKWGGHAYAEPVYDQVICPVCKGSGSVDADKFLATADVEEDDPEYIRALALREEQDDLAQLRARLTQLKRMREAADNGGYSDELPF